MTEELQKTGANTVTSTDGFTVEVKYAGGVLYRDGKGEAHINSEWLVKPHRILLYKRGFEEMAGARVESIFSNVTRALEYMDHPVEIWNS
jgi:hypothetical protein